MWVIVENNKQSWGKYIYIFIDVLPVPRCNVWDVGNEDFVIGNMITKN